MWQELEITGTGRELKGCHFPNGVSVLPATTLSQTPESVNRTRELSTQRRLSFNSRENPSAPRQQQYMSRSAGSVGRVVCSAGMTPLLRATG